MFLLFWLVFFQMKLQVKIPPAAVASCPSVMLEQIVLPSYFYFMHLPLSVRFCKVFLYISRELVGTALYPIGSDWGHLQFFPSGV